MTVTLQDVMILLGLLIYSPHVTGTYDGDWAEECEKLLGREHPPTAMSVTPRSQGYGDVMATYIREVKTTSRVR